MKKYEIIRNKTDDYTLKYKDKSFDFHTDIGIIKKVQSANKTARIKMLTDLANEGISLKKFTIEEKKDGKTYFDNTNKAELEQAYINEEITIIFNQICKDNFGLELPELITDIGLEDNEIEEFSKELAEAITGKSPSGEKENK